MQEQFNDKWIQILRMIEPDEVNLILQKSRTMTAELKPVDRRLMIDRPGPRYRCAEKTAMSRR